MPVAQLTALLLGSAGVGALVSAVVAAWSTSRERVARREELLLTSAIAMANQESELLFKAAELSEEPTHIDLYPHVVAVRWHHRQLSLLAKTGSLSGELERDYEEYIIKNHPDAATLIARRLAEKIKNRVRNKSSQ